MLRASGGGGGHQRGAAPRWHPVGTWGSPLGWIPPGQRWHSLTSSPAQAPGQVIACPQGQHSHRRVLQQVRLVCRARRKRAGAALEGQRPGWARSLLLLMSLLTPAEPRSFLGWQGPGTALVGDTGMDALQEPGKVSDSVPAACSPMQSRIQPTVPSPPQARMRKSGVSRKKLSLDGAKRERRSRSRAGGCQGRVGVAAGGRGTSVPGSGAATVQVVHLPRVEQVVKLSEDPGERERARDATEEGPQLAAGAPQRDTDPGGGAREGCRPQTGAHLPLPLPSSALGVHKHQQGMCPGPGADLRGRKKARRLQTPGPHRAWPGRAARGPVPDPTCRPCPSAVVALNLKLWLSSGLVPAGESLSDLRQWDCRSWGTGRGVGGEAVGPGQRAGRGATYQDRRADVGRQQDVVPQRAPVALRLHVRGAFVVELGGTERRHGGVGMARPPPSPPAPAHSQ